MSASSEDRVLVLASGDSARFRDWPNAAVPKRQAGVYTVWRAEQLLYVGMAGRMMRTPALPVSTSEGDAAPPDEPKDVAGLWSRLNSHASGRRSGDQFCVYICDRFVVPDLTSGQQEEVGGGRLSLDALTRDFIRGGLTYRFVVMSTGSEALSLELLLRRGELGLERPFLNPARV